MRWPLLAAALLCSGVALAQAPLPVDSLQRLAERNDTRLTTIARQTPDSARAVWSRLISLAAKAPAPDVAATHLTSARRLALAYAAAWRDSFFVRQTTRFETWTPAQRRMKASADSLRIAGGAVLGASGAAAALAVWRESARLARSIGDSAGEGGAVGNIAVAFYRSGALDSAETYLTRSRAIAERIGDQRTRLNAMGTLATIAKDRNDYPRARTLYTETLRLRESIGDDRGAASDENNLGLVALALGDTAAARRNYSAALARNQRAGRTSIATDNITNLANLATLRGDYADAARLYRDVIATRHAAGERAREAPILHNLGLLETRRGDYPAARAALSSAIAIYDSTGPREAAVAARRDLARTLGAMGALQEALGAFGAADSIARIVGRPGLQAEVALARAQFAITFNAFADAERGFIAAESLLVRTGDSVSVADAQQGRAIVMLRRGDARSARELLQRVLASRAVSSDRQAAATTQILLGYACATMADTSAARTILESAHATFTAIGDRVGDATALGVLADMELSAGHARAAEATYTRALALLRGVVSPGTEADLRAGRARARVANGALADAATELRRAIELTERIAGAIRLPERRTGFRDDKWRNYADLALIERRLGRTDSAFAVSERLRSREMLELLDAGRVTTSRASSATLVAREQDLRRRVSSLERALENARGGIEVRGLSLPADAPDASRTALDAAQKAYASLLLEIRDKAPAYDQLLRPAATDVKAIATQLRPDDALLEYLVTDSTTLVFVVRRSGTQVIDLAVNRQDLASAVAFTRDAIGDETRAGSAPLWRAPLERLHRLLIDPIERAGALRGARLLLIAPHAELHYLPFAALIGTGDRAGFLVERYDIAYVPSASLWLRLGARNNAAHSSGVLALAPRPDALPASRSEVGAIQSRYGAAATTLVGSAATVSALRARASAASIVHIATFGVLNAHNPLFSFVEMAADTQDDGHLAVHEVFGLDLHARLVVLSACQTGVASGAIADVPAGDDWVGLVRAFLHAGADNVLATLWPVRDRSAADHMRSFYQELASRSLPGALAEAQRIAIRDPRTAAPANWAAYMLTGAAR